MNGVSAELWRLSTYYDWYSRYQDGGIEALEDGRPRPRRVWNKMRDEIGTATVNLALEDFTNTKGSFVSEASVHRLLKDRGLITSPAFILIKAADEFTDKTTEPKQLWQTDFTYLKRDGMDPWQHDYEQPCCRRHEDREGRWARLDRLPNPLVSMVAP